MKIKAYLKPINNTETEILRCLRAQRQSPKTVEQLVLMMWPETKQPEKKGDTVATYLRALERRQLVKSGGGLWWVPSERGPRGGRRLAA